jgi:hypothetical protein
MNLKHINSLIIFILASYPSLIFSADLYNPLTGYLTIPRVVVDTPPPGQAPLENVVVTIQEVIAVGANYLLKDRPISGESDRYDSSTGYLTIPQVVLADQVYEDVIVTLSTLISRTDWGIVTSAAPETFPASDVSQETVDLTLKWFNIAAAEWGNYGPVEMYIIGKDVEAARNLEDTYCQRHRALDPKWEVKWDCANDNYAIFTSYVDEGGAAISTQKKSTKQYDYMMMIMSAKYPGPSEESYKPVVLHEYFHIFQHSHINDECTDDTRDECERRNKMGGKDKPWFAEGGAEFMAQWLYSKQDGVREGYFSEIMLSKLASVEAYKAQNLPLDQLSYSSNVSTYDIGTWFIAYLIHNEGIETFRDQFYGRIKTMGFDEAFELSFGKTRSQYLADFDEFLNLTEDEMMLIIDY